MTVSSSEARPFFGSLEGRVFGVCHDGGLVAPSITDNVLMIVAAMVPRDRIELPARGFSMASGLKQSVSTYFSLRPK
jgi:hypothetical protein